MSQDTRLAQAKQNLSFFWWMASYPLTVFAIIGLVWLVCYLIWGLG